MAPPFTFTISGFKPNSLTTAKDCAAKASFNSIKSIWSCFNPACFNAFGIAVTGQGAAGIFEFLK